MRNSVGPDHYARGCLLFEQRRCDLAVAELRAATADGSDPWPPAMLALVLVACRRPAEGEAAAREAIRRGPDLPFSHVALGYSFWARVRLDDAVRAAREALRLDPSHIEAHVLLARLAEAREDWPVALRHAEAGLTRHPWDTRSVVIWAHALVGLGRVADAVGALRLALGRTPEAADLHEMLGLALLHAGDEAEAVSHLREALRLAPASERAREFLAEGLRSRNRVYRASLRAALWFGRRKKIKTTSLTLAVLLYTLAMMAAVLAWPAALPWLAAGLAASLGVGLGVGLAAFIWRRLSTPLFDLLLQFDPLGRHLLSLRERVAAWTVGAFFAAAAAGFVAAAFHPQFLLFAVPTATVGPWLLYGPIVEPPGLRKWVRLAWFVPPVAAGEAGLFLAGATEALGLDEDVYALGGALLLVFAFLWFVGASWVVALFRLNKSL